MTEADKNPKTLDLENDTNLMVVKLARNYVNNDMLELGDVPDGLLEALDHMQGLITRGEVDTSFVVIQITKEGTI